MSFGAVLLLAVQPVPITAPAAPPAPRAIVARALATAEVIRAGRSGGEAGPDDVLPQRRRTSDGRVLAEFR
jgi:hypothetical protein